MKYFEVLLYLRKSRQDDPNQTVEEVLAKHETILQEYARRELGGEIPEENIYREVISGESIDEREDIKTVLSRIESPDIKGVLVMEPSRLSRGDLLDCGRLIDAFRFTNTLVVTPMMTYDLGKKMERKFFQDELLRGNDYLEYTKEILFRGRIAAAKRGCFVTYNAPYGYNRIKIGKDWTLTPNDDADTVRMIFDWYVKEGMTPGAIGRKLNNMGYKPTKAEAWSRDSIKSMLNNIHYIGKIRFNATKATWVVENGVRIKKQLRSPVEDIIISEGKHPAIVDTKIFEAAQTRIANNPKPKNDKELINPFAGILRCAHCGRVMVYDNNKGRSTGGRYICRNRPSCMRGANVEKVNNQILYALEHIELPKLREKLNNGEGNAATIQKRRIEKLVKQMEEYREQEDKQYELLETGKYTQDVFDRRNSILREKMNACDKEINMAKQMMPDNIDFAERIVTLEQAIGCMRDPDVSVKEKNRMLRNIINRINITTVPERTGGAAFKLEVFMRLGH